MKTIKILIAGIDFLKRCDLANTNYQTKLKSLSVAFEKGSSLIEVGETKIDVYVKALYRNGVFAENEQELLFWLHLAFLETLAEPVLTISENNVTVEFASYNGKAFPTSFTPPANYSNRGFINTADSSFIAQNVEYALLGLSSSALSLTSRTFSPVDGSNAKKYRHFNLTINTSSLTIHLINKTQWHEVIISTLIMILGQDHVDKMSNALQSPPKLTNMDGLSKQINMPFKDGYLSISPVFNHQVMPIMNKLRYTKNKIANFSTKKLGGTKPGNISYTALLESGDMTSFNMQMPVMSVAYERKQHLLAKKGVLDLHESISPIKQYLTLLGTEGVNKVLRKLLNNICYYLVANAKAQITQLDEKDMANLHESVIKLLPPFITGQNALPKAERAEGLLEMIVFNLRAIKGIEHQRLMTAEFNKCLRERVMENV